MNVLIVAAHTDDEALGCGGTIARHVAEGDEVCVIYMADGVSSREAVDSGELAVRQAAAKEAQAVLGISSAFYLGFPDNKMDTLAMLDVVKPLEEIIEKTAAEIIYTHHHGDLNVDHRITFQAVMTACRPLPEAQVRAIYSFEVPSSSEWSLPGKDNVFSPNRFVNITDYLAIKMEALGCYKEEMRNFPHARSLETLQHLAKLRGASVGMAAAEAFAVAREIVK